MALLSQHVPAALIHYPLFGNIRARLSHRTPITFAMCSTTRLILENMGFVSLQLYLRTMLANDVTDIETMVDECSTAIYGPAACRCGRISMVNN